jgi:hypothetical protein
VQEKAIVDACLSGQNAQRPHAAIIASQFEIGNESFCQGTASREGAVTRLPVAIY